MAENENNELNKSGDFNLPPGYFASSAQKIQNKILWEDEHREYSSLRRFRDKTVFGIPENYFFQSESKLELVCFPELNRLRSSQPFKVPESYFQNNSKKLYDVVAPEKVGPKINAETKVIKLFSRKIMYSVAAMLTVVLGVWIYSLYFEEAPRDCGTIACIDKNDVLKSKNLEAIEESDLYELINTSDLEQKLKLNLPSNKGSDSTSEINIDDLPDEI